MSVSGHSDRRPARIDQIIPAIVQHDAVSNHTFSAQRLLREMGFASEIYALIIGPGCEGRVRPLREIERHADGSQWVLYQCSIGSPAADAGGAPPGSKASRLPQHRPRRLGREMVASARRGVAPWPAPAGGARLARVGRVRRLGVQRRGTGRIRLSEPKGRAGARRVRESPCGSRPARPRTVSGAQRAGGTDWLFVGQIGPHKAQHDVIKAFAVYRRAYDAHARLHIVGREMGTIYIDALRRFAVSLGLGEAVEFPGSVPVGTLAAYYESADAFVCLSDHEGFCAPIVEAMARGTPVVAFAAAAVPETLGEAGVLLAEKPPELVASVVHRLLRDDETRGDVHCPRPRACEAIRPGPCRARLSRADRFGARRAEVRRGDPRQRGLRPLRRCTGTRHRRFSAYRRKRS